MEVLRDVATKDLVVEDPAGDNRCHDSHHGQESVAHRLETLLRHASRKLQVRRLDAPNSS